MEDMPASGEGDPVSALVEQLLERFDSEGDSALEQLCREHPQHASVLRRRVALLRDAGVFEAQLEIRVPERLGEYRLVRPLGGGGMGVVYLAVQEGLGREVALKIVRPEHLYFPGTRERFQREVETIARLHHPGIVPVYSVGEENGIPYFAMERVRGRSLQEALDVLRGRDASKLEGHDLAPQASRDDYLFRGTWEQACLRVVRQVADALEHAHQQGVLHRDLKPSNVMLSSVGASRALLLDFGLASMEGSERLTRSGAQLGTLHYMSPEQAGGSGATVSARSDVYSLGVLLYELLTLQRPFDGQSDADVVVAIQQGRRKKLRDLNAAISWDAETVCLTALDVDPARRYATAADFARDLGNVLEHHPIEARRASVPLRVRRWARRHPAASVALVLGGCVVVGAPVMYAWQQRRAATLVLAQRDRAEKNLGRALEAVDRMLTHVSEVDLRFVPQMEPVRKALLEDAVKLLRDFLVENSDDARVRLQCVRAQERLSELLSELGRADEAVAQERDAIASLEQIDTRDDGPISASERDDLLIAAHIQLARALAEAGRNADARREHEDIAARLTVRLASEPTNPQVRGWMATNDGAFATMLRGTGEIEASKNAFERAIAANEALSVELPDDVSLQGGLATLVNEYGMLLLDHFTAEDGSNPEAERVFGRAIELFEDLCRREDEPRNRYLLATVRSNLAGVLRRRGDFAGARAAYEESRTELAELTRDFPDTMANEFELATCLNQLGLLEDVQEHYQDAEQFYREGLEHLDALARRVPRQHLLLNRVGIAEFNVGVKTMNRGSHEEALRHIERAVEMQKVAIELGPDQVAYPDDLAVAYKALHNVRLALGDHHGAAEAAELLARGKRERWEDRTRAAAGLARCVAFVRASDKLAPAERETLARNYSERAVAQLRAAFEGGMPDPTEIRTINVLDPLRDTEAFKQLLRELK